MDTLYHEGMRRLQEARETRPLADRLAKVTVRQQFTDEERAFIERCAMFFLATADAEGHPDCSYKGGVPGFVRVVDDHTLAFPDYIHRMHLDERSVYAPRPGHEPPVPAWKTFDAFRDALPPRDRASSASDPEGTPT
jgi:predicted pyridoxine 5'-phosphate oxidase superfamily flavin-nucleotide-binding protein